jgi:hypothetical protein
MLHDGSNWRMRTRRGVLILSAALSLAFAASAVHAQNIMRSPNLNVGSRTPTINPNIAARPNLGVDTVARTRPDLGVRSTLSATRFPSSQNTGCPAASRGPDGACSVASADGGKDNGKGGSARKLAKKGKGGADKGSSQAAVNLRSLPNELVAEIDGSLSTADADALARRHGLERISSENLPLLGSTIGLFRIVDRRPLETARRQFAADASVRSVQFNFRYFLQQQRKATIEGDAVQYAVAQLRLPQAHQLVRGMNVTIAVIDSGVDARHPELANSVADNFDALGSKEGPHVHGTGIAGAIVAHARLMGSAPEARLLAIRAFGGGSKGESTSYVIIRGMNYAAEHGAQIINMSFAGPKDPLIERAIAATAARGILMVAAAGNAGAKSPPLYPAANPNVIAVSGTDAQEKLFAASNRGNHIAIAAPGADIFLPAPGDKYQITSGTSFSAAYISGVAALIMERNPALKPNDVRAILMKTARDIGSPGRDDLFGAGNADAFAAVTAAAAAPAVPLAAATGKPAGENPAASDNASVSRALNDAVPSMASEKSAANAANKPAAQ